MLDTRRVTEGVFIGSGEAFTIIDDYGNPACAHRVLPNAWRGTTTFGEKNFNENKQTNVRQAVSWADADYESDTGIVAQPNAPKISAPPIYSLSLRRPASAVELGRRV